MSEIKLCVTLRQVGGGSGSQAASITIIGFAQQSVHLTLGILRQSQAVFYALAFSQLDGFAVPTPAQVTQTVRQPVAKNTASFVGKFSFVLSTDKRIRFNNR